MVRNSIPHSGLLCPRGYRVGGKAAVGFERFVDMSQPAVVRRGFVGAAGVSPGARCAVSVFSGRGLQTRIRTVVVRPA